MAPLKSLQRYVLCAVTCGLVAVSLGTLVTCSEDLYHLLGVSRSASDAEITKAFRKQARIWHPDKNKSPNARDRFTAINEAYQVLSNSDKRRNYDVTGKVGDSPQPTGHSRGQGFTFSQGGGFRFFFNSAPTHRSDGINTNQFYDEVLPQSYHKPYLLNFYADFCLACGDVEVIWKALHKDLTTLGVGLGSVHARMHPKITQHCGVSHVPSIVGVVSGRVHRYYGQLRDKATMISFLENIIPKHIITLITDSNVDQFLSAAIPRNKPRLLLFSPRDTPSLLYLVTAFANLRMADFGFVSTHGEASQKVLSRYGVQAGEKKLFVFKEVFHPSYVTTGTLNQEVLQSTLVGLTLVLPRLSSQTLLNTACPLASNSFCVVLLVPGPAAYNDTLTATFRTMGSDGSSRLDHFAYIDTSRQSDFLSALKPIPSGKCVSGHTARPVLILKRSSNRFDWFDQFCGDSDTTALQSHLSSLRSQVSLMTPLPALPSITDEEAPGLVERVWGRVTEFILDLNDFFLALGSGAYTPLVSLLFAILVFCMVGLCIRVTDDTQPRHPGERRHPNTSTHHSNGDHPHHNIHRPRPIPHRSQQAHVHEMNPHTYHTLTQSKHKQAQIALVILIDTQCEKESKQMMKAFCRVVSHYRDYRLRLYYLCYKIHKKWLKNVLKECVGMSANEVTARVSGCLSGTIATVVTLLNLRKQVCVFPELISTQEEGNEKSSDNHILTIGTTNPQDKSQENFQSGKNSPKVRSVGDVFGSMFDFDEKDERQSKKPRENGHVKKHKNGTVESVSDTSLQLHIKFETWMDKFADGTLRRYKVTNWPQWQS